MTSQSFTTRTMSSIKAMGRFEAFVLLGALTLVSCSKQELSKDQLLARADEAFAAQKYIEAEKNYRNVLRVSSEEPTALARLATIYYEQGQLPQAYPLLKKSAELQPDNVDLQLKLGMLQLATGEHAQAREAAV